MNIVHLTLHQKQNEQLPYKIWTKWATLRLHKLGA